MRQWSTGRGDPLCKRPRRDRADADGGGELLHGGHGGRPVQGEEAGGVQEWDGEDLCRGRLHQSHQLAALHKTRKLCLLNRIQCQDCEPNCTNKYCPTT